MRQMNAEASRLGQELRLRVQVRSFDGICQMVATGLGLGLLPLSAAKAHSQSMPLSLITLDEPWASKRSLVVGWRQDASLSPHALKFLDMLRQRV
jgi:DNA-binding transcriptional LysR family regulator